MVIFYHQFLAIFVKIWKLCWVQASFLTQSSKIILIQQSRHSKKFATIRVKLFWKQWFDALDTSIHSSLPERLTGWPIKYRFGSAVFNLSCVIIKPWRHVYDQDGAAESSIYKHEIPFKILQNELYYLNFLNWPFLSKIKVLKIKWTRKIQKTLKLQKL